MLKLRNLSKYYYNKGIIASGFTKVNLEFNIGEFVAITGESGSGKSTLLNVISGLDSYEDGEMYIFDKETSHYSNEERETFRKNYIGNIFQNFNLVNSYTVYQNVELVLLLNGFKRNEVKDKILDILKKVNMYEFKNSKVSKLSGGQKQRVAIARCLAKECPIIVADEPTGNLDKKNAEEVIKLLHDISKDKLVIIVTHNYEQVEPYVTRKITMGDGRVVEDKKIVNVEKKESTNNPNFKNINILGKLRLGIRNSYNIFTKWSLISFVFIFIMISLFTAISSYRMNEYDDRLNSYNMLFSDSDPRRIILKKKDLTNFTEKDLEKIKNIEHVDKIYEKDFLLDYSTSVEDNEGNYFYGSFYPISEFKDKLTYGNMPINDNEMIIEKPEDYYYNMQDEKLLNKNYYIFSYKNQMNNPEDNIKLVGIKNIDEYTSKTKFYVSESSLKKIYADAISEHNEITIEFEKNNMFETNLIVQNSKIPKGYAYIPETWLVMCEELYCKDKELKFESKDIYSSKSKTLKVKETLNKNNINKLFNLTYEEYENSIFINPEDFYELLDKGDYQISIYADDEKNVESITPLLDKLGYNALVMKNTYYDNSAEMFLINLISKVLMLFLVLVLFLISYFVIRLILKSRKDYFATLRILGCDIKSLRNIIGIELLTDFNIMYILFVIVLLIISKDIIIVEPIKKLCAFVSFKDYFTLYAILFIMSNVLTLKISKNIFKNTALDNYRQEV